MQKNLLHWYRQRKRDLPWRTNPPHPYYVWLSEMMLQQTTVATVIPYFYRFIQRWPTLADLAQADIDEVLHMWQGLGYYARARNLLACARLVEASLGGVFPQDVESLMQLPGIGPYAAGAISAIAFQRWAVVVDGNVVRVLSRVYCIEGDAQQKEIRKRMGDLTPTSASTSDVGDFVQAVMELGALICRPVLPKCTECPWQTSCGAYAANRVGHYPVKKAPILRPYKKGIVIWLESVSHGSLDQRKVWVRQRSQKGLLGGLWEFPSTSWLENEAVENEAAVLPPLIQGEFPWGALPPLEKVGEVHHVFTHFRLSLSVLRGRWSEPIWAQTSSEKSVSQEGSQGFFCPVEKLNDLAFPTLMRKVIKMIV